MPFWGIALANGPTYNSGTYLYTEAEARASVAIEKAKQLYSNSPESERAYIDALGLRYATASQPDFQNHSRDYISAMLDLHQRYPDDPDAATLYAESLMELHPYSLWTVAGIAREDTPEIVSTLESTLRRWPNHVGANHFYVHVMEVSPEPDRALTSAQRLKTLVPLAGHLLHMPAHIYMRTGDYAAAVRSCLDARIADLRYQDNESGATNKQYDQMYAKHNLYFLVQAADFDGEFNTALSTAKVLEADARRQVATTPKAEAYMTMPLFVLVRFARWNDILKLQAPDPRLRGLSFFWHYARGCALAMNGHIQEAQNEYDSMHEIYKRLVPSEIFGVLDKWETLCQLAVDTLGARIARARGDSPSAIGYWQAAVKTQDSIDHYHEPPIWYCSIHEALGAALLEAGRLGDAERTFRDDLVRNPRNPRSLFGLARTLSLEGKTSEADWIRESLAEVWRGSSEDLQIEKF